MHKRLLMILCILAFTLACGEKPVPTEKEKGKADAQKKMDYVGGAAGVVADKGESVGEVTGKGIGNLIQGIGDGLQKTIYPPVKMLPSNELQSAGIKVQKAEEGSSTDAGNEVKLALHFDKVYKGRFMLHALDKGNTEIGRAVSKVVNQPPDSLLNLTVNFHRDMDMDELAYCKIVTMPPREMTLVMGEGDGSAAGDAVTLGQTQEHEGTPLKVSQYVIFNQAFSGALQLRAYDTTNAEIGRSQSIKDLTQEADSAMTFDFEFHATLSVDSINRYELHVKPTAAKGKKRGKK